MFASIRNPDALSHAVARPRTAIRLLFGEALVLFLRLERQRLGRRRERCAIEDA